MQLVLDIEALEFYCKVYPSCAELIQSCAELIQSCAELIQKYSASNSDENVVFTEQDRQKLLINLQQDAGAYLNSLHIQDVAMLLSSNERLHANIKQLIKNDQYKLISSSFKGYVSQCDNATHTEIEALMDMLQADGIDVPDHHGAEIDVTGENVEYVL